MRFKKARARKPESQPPALPQPYDPHAPGERWTPVPDEFRHLGRDGKLTGLTQIALLLYLVEAQWGVYTGPPPGLDDPHPQMRAWTEPIPLATLALKCNASDFEVQTVIDDAVERGLIARQKFIGENSYSYQVLVENWPNVRKPERI